MKTILKVIFNLWVIVGAIVIAAILIGVIAAAVYAIRPTPPSGVPTAVVMVIPAPTSTQPGIVSPTETPALTPTVPASPAPGVIELGATVEIAGTDGEGLNLRSTPGLNGKVQYLGLESEVFVVQDGPQEVDGVTWWYLVGFFDEGRSGWAASNYLQTIQNP
ncbi:MAG TPA: hypothetical protein PK530_05820 [Anaerolineales bacterium]|nr:hypothetical protein [Anaerolineales bacterium]